MKQFLFSSSKGQGMVEYIILTTLIALAAIAIIALFGKQEKSQFAAMTQSLAGKTAVVDTQPALQATQEAAVSPTMQRYGGDPSSSSGAAGTTTTSEPTPSNGTETTPTTTPSTTPSDTTTPPPVTPPAEPPAPPPTPPAPTPTVLTNTTSVEQRHHVGDGNYSQGAGGGSLLNEGVNFSYNFSALRGTPRTQRVTLSFEASGVNDTTNAIILNGNNIGVVHNGVNTFEFNGDSLQENNTFHIVSNQTFIPNYGMDYDDFEFWNFNATRFDSQG